MKLFSQSFIQQISWLLFVVIGPDKRPRSPASRQGDAKGASSTPEKLLPRRHPEECRSPESRTSALISSEKAVVALRPTPGIKRRSTIQQNEDNAQDTNIGADHKLES